MQTIKYEIRREIIDEFDRLDELLKMQEEAWGYINLNMARMRKTAFNQRKILANSLISLGN